MKAAILAECPGATLVDVSHSLEPFAFDPASFVLWAATRHFAPGSVHLAVVDPGVGTARRAVALAAAGRFYVGPDNGLFSVVLESAGASTRAVELPRPGAASATFEGRDVFAPAAGRLAAGAGLDSLGPPVEPAGLVRLPDSGPRVVWVDRFGNLVLSLRPPARALRVGGVPVTHVARTFEEAPDEVPFCYVGSMGRLEVAVKRGRADGLLRARAGTPVEDSPPP